MSIQAVQGSKFDGSRFKVPAWFILLSSFILQPSALPAPAPPPGLAQFVPRDPWRAIEGTTNYVKLEGVEFCGKVMDITTDGVILNGLWGPPYRTHYFPTVYTYPDYFVANFPFRVEDGQTLGSDEHLMAWDTGGTYEYKTVKGMYRSRVRTIHKLDYGIPCGIPPELLKQAATTASARAARLQQYAAEARTNAFRLLQSQAGTNEAARYRLALCYLNGAGCPTNRDEAIKCLRQSAETGNQDASNKLATLPAP